MAAGTFTPIPIRCWIGPDDCRLGYLRVSHGETVGDTTSYEMSFREAELSEPPRFEMWIHPSGAITLR